VSIILKIVIGYFAVLGALLTILILTLIAWSMIAKRTKIGPLPGGDA
jgi:hypothetical protein